VRGSAYAKAKADAMRRSAYAKAKADAMRGSSVALRAMVAYAKASATGHGCDEENVRKSREKREKFVRCELQILF
jgi:hypothetical protein